MAKNIRDEGLRILALGTSANASGRDVSRSSPTSVLSDAVPRQAGSPHHTSAEFILSSVEGLSTNSCTQHGVGG